MVNAMILSAELHFNLWRDVLFTACHEHNRVPSKKITVSPYELWNGRNQTLIISKCVGV